MNLNVALSFSDFQSTMKYVRDQDVIVDDVKCFEKFCYLKAFVKNVQNNKDFKSASVSDKWVKYFSEAP
jgi:hypothetical protein